MNNISVDVPVGMTVPKWGGGGGYYGDSKCFQKRQSGYREVIVKLGKKKLKDEPYA